VTERFAKSLLELIAGLYTAGLLVYLALRGWLGDRLWWLALVNTFAHLLFLPLAPLLTVAGALRSRRALLSLLPPTLLMLVWLSERYWPKKPPPSAGRRLHVLTGNVWILNTDTRRIEPWLRRINADLVILQEVLPEYAGAALPRLLDLYPYQFRHEEGVRWADFPSLNITLSRYPILEHCYVDLGTPNTISPQRLVIDCGGQRLAVYNVHLAWPGGRAARFGLKDVPFYLRAALGYDDTLRNRQITRLLEHLKREPYPFIVGGDFNTSDQSPTYQRLAACLHDAFREAGVGFGATWPTSGTRGLPAFIPPFIRIDYIWRSAGLRALKAWRGPGVGSDHLPVQAVLEIVPEGAKTIPGK
jgi:endonuclease/exonuclease/phosphatase (EEP) superfamily protein YafD